MCIEVIVCNVTVVILRHSVHVKIKLLQSPYILVLSFDDLNQKVYEGILFIFYGENEVLGLH